MATVSLTGQDTLTLDDRNFSDFADGDFAAITFQNDIAAVKTGKNNNSIYAFNSTGNQADLILRILRGSADDKYLQGRMAQQQSNFSGFVLLTGEFIKKIGNGQGQVTSDTYIMSGGIFFKFIEVKSNAEGDTEQSVAVYSIRFANAPRVIT